MDTSNEDFNLSITLGPGLIQDNNVAIITQNGVLRFSDPDKWWIDSYQKKYVPSTGDSVIGIVCGRMGDLYKVDIGNDTKAMLPFLAFEGATRRNRPVLKNGQLIFCRVSVAHKDMEPELTCIHPESNKAEGYGELSAGFMIKCSLFLCRSLLTKNTAVLAELAKILPFEIAVGLNGRVWVKADSIEKTVFVQEVIQRTELLPKDSISREIKVLMDKFNIE